MCSFSSNNVVIKMSENTVYQSNKGPMVSQSNPSYITTEDIHLYEEIPGGKSLHCWLHIVTNKKKFEL